MSKKIEPLVLEPHYLLKQIQEQYLPLSIDTLRRIFKDTEGVVKHGHLGRRTTGKYVTLLVPKSVLERKIAEMQKVAR